MAERQEEDIICKGHLIRNGDERYLCQVGVVVETKHRRLMGRYVITLKYNEYRIPNMLAGMEFVITAA